jgi:hypothetical protein
VGLKAENRVTLCELEDPLKYKYFTHASSQLVLFCFKSYQIEGLEGLCGT